MTIFLARASAMAHHVGDETVSAAWARACNDLVHRVVEIIRRGFAGVLPACLSPGRPDLALGGGVAPVRSWNWIRRLQPQPRSQRGPLDLTAPDRQDLVPVLRGDDRAGHTGDGCTSQPRTTPRSHRHRRALSQWPTRQHLCSCCRPTLSPTFRVASDHPARGRSGSLPLGPLSRACRHAWSPEPDSRTLASLMGNVFFDTCVLPPAWHQPAVRRIDTRTSFSARR